MIYNLFGALLAQLPLLLVYIIGVILAFRYRRSFPRVTIYLFLATALSFLIQLLSTAVYTAVPYFWLRGEVDAVTYGVFNYAVGVISNIGHAAAFGLLLTAIFTGRHQRDPQKPHQSPNLNA